MPEAGATDLFVRLHGMLFTKIDLDNFPTVMSRYMERLEEDLQLNKVTGRSTISQVDWMIMGSVNLASLLQYGSMAGVIRKALALEGQERRRAHAVGGDGDVDADDAEREPGGDDIPVLVEPPASISAEEDKTLPKTLIDAIELCMPTFSFLLANPTRQQGLQTILNPYLTIMLTFLATLFRQPHVGETLLPHIPWSALVEFLSSSHLDIKDETRLASNLPLPEDWTLRGMEWVGRRVYERGFWKIKSSSRGSGAMAQPQPRTGERFQSEMDVLLASFDSPLDISEGVVEEADGTDLTDGPAAVNHRRWKRVAWAAGVMVKHVEGLDVVDGKVVIAGTLKARLDEIERVKEVEAAAERELMAKREKERADEWARLSAQAAEMDSEDDDPDLAALRVRTTMCSVCNHANSLHRTAEIIFAPSPTLLLCRPKPSPKPLVKE